ncbi:M20 metallopeptidase family protein [Hornefia butyriciproducens]|uniref:M20 metallopeptidase family protein n=1 Tax=Hornefia butyriciproducens TaxID=2652293 RepID=UPI0023F38F53|nr:M20 family metallopeptidase [Hornefia butyriciproducens]MDD6299023.1 M20 family metallopeptidase [Hornefia butyriciproducens]
MNTFLGEAKENFTQITQDRRQLHRQPEIGFDLPVTVKYVQTRLSEMGIESRLCGGVIDEKLRQNFMKGGFPYMKQCYGVTATIGEGEPCILLRADMDALPMPENAELEFKSEIENRAHMCGHDAHTAMLLGAAQILKNHEAELPGTVKLMFQPGEECGCGSKFMVDDGILENPTVNAAFMIHVMPQLNVGKVQYSTGIASAAMDTFIVDIKGKGGHSSEPQKTIDPLLISNQLYTALNLLSGRETDPKQTVAMTVGTQTGGTAINVIPDESHMGFSFRTFDRTTREHLLRRVPEIVDHTVKMWRGEYSLCEFHTPSTYTDAELCASLRPALEKVVLSENIEKTAPMSGTEDFGYVTERVPGMAVWLGAGTESSAPLHNPDMQLDEDCLPIGAAIYVNAAWGWLRNH